MERNSSFTIGKVTGVHGLGGNLKVWSYAESIDTFLPGRTVLLKAENEPGKTHSILKAGPHKKGVLLVLDGIDNRELAEDQIGKLILIDREQLPEPEDGSWYWQDLIGMNVTDHIKGDIGEITDIFPTGANDILVVIDGKDETLVPMHKNFVESVDMDTSTVRTTLPEDY